LGGSLILRCSEVARYPGPIVHQDGGLIPTDHRYHFFRPPDRGVIWSHAIEPEDVYLAVITRQFADLFMSFLHETFVKRRWPVLLLIPLETARMAPVHKRKVETGPHSCRAARVGELTCQVSSERGCDTVEICRRRVEKTETIVVANRKNHVFHARISGQTHPFHSVTRLRVEQLFESRVLLPRNVFPVLRPDASF